MQSIIALSLLYGKKIRTKFIIGMLIMLCWTAEANAKHVNLNDNKQNPPGCRDVGYSFALKTLFIIPGQAGARQSLYFIFNKLNEPVTLYQMRDDGGTRSLYLNHAIAAQKWSVLSTSEKELRFTCTINISGFNYKTIVDCGDSIRVCEYNHVIFGLNNRGNYWLNNSY